MDGEVTFRHSGMVRHQTRKLEIPGSMLCTTPE
jgi:hypothetical protein